MVKVRLSEKGAVMEIDDDTDLLRLPERPLAEGETGYPENEMVRVTASECEKGKKYIMPGNDGMNDGVPVEIV